MGSIDLDLLVQALVVNVESFPSPVDVGNPGICSLESEGGEAGGIEQPQGRSIQGEVEDRINLRSDGSYLPRLALSRDVNDALELQEEAVLPD